MQQQRQWYQFHYKILTKFLIIFIIFCPLARNEGKGPLFYYNQKVLTKPKKILRFFSFFSFFSIFHVFFLAIRPSKPTQLIHFFLINLKTQENLIKKIFSLHFHNPNNFFLFLCRRLCSMYSYLFLVPLNNKISCLLCLWN